MTQGQQPIQSRIPEFASRAEEAEFWDTHDVTDYWDELKPVDVRFAKNVSGGIIAVRLDLETLQQLRALAEEKRIGASELVRTWILEGLSDSSRTRTP